MHILPQHCGTAQLPFLSEKAKNRKCTPNKEPRENKVYLSTHEQHDEVRHITTESEGKKRSRGPIEPPTGWQTPLQGRFPVMVPQLEHYPGQYQNMMFDPYNMNRPIYHPYMMYPPTDNIKGSEPVLGNDSTLEDHHEAERGARCFEFSTLI